MTRKSILLWMLTHTPVLADGRWQWETFKDGMPILTLKDLQFLDFNQWIRRVGNTLVLTTKGREVAEGERRSLQRRTSNSLSSDALWKARSSK